MYTDKFIPHFLLFLSYPTTTFSSKFHVLIFETYWVYLILPVYAWVQLHLLKHRYSPGIHIPEESSTHTPIHSHELSLIPWLLTGHRELSSICVGIWDILVLCSSCELGSHCEFMWVMGLSCQANPFGKQTSVPLALTVFLSLFPQWSLNIG